MTLEKQIEILKEWHKGAEMSLPIMSSADIERFLHWLEGYKQLKADYIDLDNRLRTANTEINRLQSESSWISCSERTPATTEEGLGCLYSDCSLVASSKTGWVGMAYYLTDGKKSWWEFADAQNKVKIDWDEVTHWMTLPQSPKEV